MYNKETNFQKWVAGLTEASGNFDIKINKKTQTLSLSYSIIQPISNIKILNYIKSILKCGIVLKNVKYAKYSVKDKEVLRIKIIPLFEKINTFFTSKEFDFNQFKKVLEIWDSNLTKIEKMEKIEAIKNNKKPENYIPSVYKHPEHWIKTLLHKFWLIGYTETIGNFTIIKNKNRNVLEYNIRGEWKLLKIIKEILNISSSINKKHNNYSLKTQELLQINNILKYYHNQLQGVKSLEYKIWSRAFKYLYQPKNLSKWKTILNNFKNITY